MSFDTVSALEIPQLATELTTEELKQICGGWNCDNNNNNNNDDCNNNKKRHHRHHHKNRHHDECGDD